MKIWTNNDLDLGKMRLHSIAQTVSFVIHKIHKIDKYAQCRKASLCKHLNKSANQEKRAQVYLCFVQNFCKVQHKADEGGSWGGGGVAEGVWRKHVCLAFAFALPCLPLRNIDVPDRNIALHGITLPLPGALLPLLLRSMMCTMCTAHVHIVQDFVQ